MVNCELICIAADGNVYLRDEKGAEYAEAAGTYFKLGDKEKIPYDEIETVRVVRVDEKEHFSHLMLNSDLKFFPNLKVLSFEGISNVSSPMNYIPFEHLEKVVLCNELQDFEIFGLMYAPNLQEIVFPNEYWQGYAQGGAALAIAKNLKYGHLPKEWSEALYLELAAHCPQVVLFIPDEVFELQDEVGNMGVLYEFASEILEESAHRVAKNNYDSRVVKNEAALMKKAHADLNARRADVAIYESEVEGFSKDFGVSRTRTDGANGANGANGGNGGNPGSVQNSEDKTDNASNTNGSDENDKNNSSGGGWGAWKA